VTLPYQLSDLLGAVLGAADCVQYWEAGIRRDGKPAPIPYTVALACAAIYHRLPPWE
jgi:hypothetical protein